MTETVDVDALIAGQTTRMTNRSFVVDALDALDDETRAKFLVALADQSRQGSAIARALTIVTGIKLTGDMVQAWRRKNL